MVLSTIVPAVFAAHKDGLLKDVKVMRLNLKGQPALEVRDKRNEIDVK